MGNKLFDGLLDDATVDQLVNQYADMLSRKAETIEKAFLADDLEVLAELAHELKGVAGMYGFSRVSEKALDVRRIVAQPGDTKRLEVAVFELSKVCREAAKSRSEAAAKAVNPAADTDSIAVARTADGATRVKRKGRQMTKPATVYIVDDDEGVVQPIVKVVESIGLQAETYPSAEEFLDKCRPDGPACLVLDVWMPEMSGVALLARLAEAAIRPPVIVITAHADVKLAVEVMRKGALNFLEKPFRMQALSESIQEAIRLDRESWRSARNKKTRRTGFGT